MIVCSDEEALSNRRATDYFGAAFARRGYFRPRSAADGPQAYLIEQSAASVVRSHFHDTDQFQVVVRGSGTLARRPLAPITVQYADAFTAYGPIVSGTDGLWYFSLRSRLDAGAVYLPEGRDSQRSVRPGRRQRMGATSGPSHAVAVPSCEPTVLIPEEPDGLAADLVSLGPDAPTLIACPARSAGCYVLVVAGATRVHGSSLCSLSLLFVEPTEAVSLAADDGTGAVVLVLTFPEPPGDRLGQVDPTHDWVDVRASNGVQGALR